MEYHNLDLEAFEYHRAEDGAEHFCVRVSTSPVGEQRHEHSEQVVVRAGLRRRFRQLERRALNLQQMIGLGEDLADLLFPPRARLFLTRSRASLDADEALRIRLKMHTYALADLPWEYVYVPPPDTPPDQKGLDGFLVLDRRVSLVRYEVMGQGAGSLDPVGTGPLRLVAILANPEDPAYSPLDLEVERRNIERALDDMSDVLHAEFYTDATVEVIEDALTDEAHVFHFAGHGRFDGDLGVAFGSVEGEGSIVLLDEDGGPFPFPAEKLARNLSGRGVRLAVLGACEVGRRDQVNAWTGVVPALTRAGVPAVVGMQYKVRDKNAVAFSRRFYRALAAGQAIDAAVTDGRLAIFNRSGRNERDWGVPVLYMRTDEGVLFPSGQPASPAEPREAEPEPSTVIRVEQKIDTVPGGKVVGVAMEQPAGARKSKARRDLEQELEKFEGPSLQPAMDDVDKWVLREKLVNDFGLEDLQDLCYFVEQALEQNGVQVMGRPLQVNLEILGGSGKRAKVLNLIQYLDRRGHLGYLVAAMRKFRPGSI